MTLQPVFAQDGGTYFADQLRMMQQIAAMGAEGVVSVGDLAVRPLPTPGPGARIVGGSAFVLGRDGLAPGDTSAQGTYAAWNRGDHQVELDGTAGAGARSDLLVLRVEDSTWPGSGWTRPPGSAPVPHVIQGVPPTTMTIPAQYRWSAIPLARINWTPNTSTLTAGMITDLRQVANPKTQSEERTQRGGTLTGGEWDEAGNIVAPAIERWPQHEWVDIRIPRWATQASITGNWDLTFLKPLNPVGANDARGELHVGLVGSPGALRTEPSAYNFNQFSSSNGYRCSAANRDTIPIPAAWRGLTVSARMYVSGTPGQAGRLVADNWANFGVRIEFREVPVLDATL